MTKSSEYPDLEWVSPKSWTDANRSSVQLVVIHTTEGSAHSGSAEDGAAYDKRRTDGTSTHYFHDSNSTIQCVHTKDQSHTARTQGNRRGIHHELCTRSGSADWDDDYHQAMLRKVAKQAARDSKKWDIPVRHLTVSEVAAGKKGFCGHYDVTRAFPQDNGTHTDPGSNFPWTKFLNLVRAELAPPIKTEESMSAAELKTLTTAISAMESRLKAEIDKVAADVLSAKVGSKTIPARTVKMGLGDLFNQLRPWLWLAPTSPERREIAPQSGSVLDYLANKLPAEIAELKASIAKAQEK